MRGVQIVFILCRLLKMGDGYFAEKFDWRDEADEAGFYVLHIHPVFDLRRRRPAVDFWVWRFESLVRRVRRSHDDESGVVRAKRDPNDKERGSAVR